VSDGCWTAVREGERERERQRDRERETQREIESKLPDEEIQSQHEDGETTSSQQRHRLNGWLRYV